jgi:hypothetical protein
MGAAPAGETVAGVEALATIKLIRARPAVELIPAAFAVAAILPGPHPAHVIARPTPAAVAAGTGLAVVVAGIAYAIAVLLAGDAGVVARPTDAAVTPRPFGIAGVLLAIADEFVRAVAEMDREGEGKRILDFDEVARGAHVEFDRTGAVEAADGEIAVMLETTPGTGRGPHPALNDEVAAAHAQPQMRTGVGSVHDDLPLGRGGSAAERQPERGGQRDDGRCCPCQKDREDLRRLR